MFIFLPHDYFRIHFIKYQSFVFILHFHFLIALFLPHFYLSLTLICSTHFLPQKTASTLWLLTEKSIIFAQTSQNSHLPLFLFFQNKNENSLITLPSSFFTFHFSLFTFSLLPSGRSGGGFFPFIPSLSHAEHQRTNHHAPFA